MGKAAAGVYCEVQDWNELALTGYWKPQRPSFGGSTTLVWTLRVFGWTEPVHREVSDEEFLRLAEQDGHFDFLADPSEDIYSWEDGEEV